MKTARSLLLSCLICILSLHTHAQLTQQWKRDFGFNAVDLTYPFKGIVDQSGNIYCSVLVLTNISTDACDTLWILKYDPAGNLNWSLPFKKGNGTLCTDFVMDSDSNLLVLASNYQGTSPLTKNFNVIKIDTAGTVLWDKNFNDSSIYSRSNLLSLIPGTADMIVTNWASFGSQANVVYARRIDTNGNQLWKYTDTLRFEPGSQWVDNAGFFHFTTEEKITLQKSYMRYKKLDLNGAVVDSFAFDYQFATRSTNRNNLFVDNSGNVFINISVQASTLNIYHQLLLQLNSTADSVNSFEDVNLIPKFMTHNPVTGNLMMGNIEGTNFTQHRSSVSLLNQCSFIDSTQITPNTFLTDQTINSSGELYTLNFFDRISKLDPSGNLLWQYPTPVFVNALDQDKFNYKVVYNNFTGDLYYLFADRLTNSDPHGVFQIIKYAEDSVPVSLQNIFSSKQVVKLLPNPAHDFIYIQHTSADEITEVKIFSIDGMLSLYDIYKNGIDVSALPAGIYYAQVEIDGVILRKKFVKIN